MIATHTIKQPLTFQKKPSNLWAAAPFVLSVVGHLLFDWKEPHLIGLLTIGWGFAYVLFFKRLVKKKAPVKNLTKHNLHFTPETIEINSRTYTVSSLRNLRLDVGHYDGELTVNRKGVRVALEGIKLLTDGPVNNPEFYDGSDNHLSFLAGGTKVFLSFYIGSEAQHRQFRSLLKAWYAAGIPVQEFSYGMRTYLGEQMNYAQIQEFKARWQTGKRMKLAGR